MKGASIRGPKKATPKSPPANPDFHNQNLEVAFFDKGVSKRGPKKACRKGGREGHLEKGVGKGVLKRGW